MIRVILSKGFEINLTTSPCLEEKEPKLLFGLTSSEIFLAKDTGLRIIAMQITSWIELNIVVTLRIARAFFNE